LKSQPVSVSQLPNKPAVYALYGGEGRSLHVAYVGNADVLKRRISQHLIKRDSSVATGTSAVGLNPDYVTELRWWEDPVFVDQDNRRAAELVATELLEPALRSRGKVSRRAKRIHSDKGFQERMRQLFSGKATGSRTFPTLEDTMRRIARLEERVTTLERRSRRK